MTRLLFLVASAAAVIAAYWAGREAEWRATQRAAMDDERIPLGI